MLDYNLPLHPELLEPREATLHYVKLTHNQSVLSYEQRVQNPFVGIQTTRPWPFVVSAISRTAKGLMPPTARLRVMPP